jgi:alpha-amylase/alpha-mannosidase (GH57 family)
MVSLRKFFLTAILATSLILSYFAFVPGALAQPPLNLVIIWHFHQPPYYDPEQNVYVLPWVRIHSVANYYKMASILSNYPDVKVTFTFTGSLMEQINDYVTNNQNDTYENLSWKIALNQTLSVDEKFSMLQVPGGFFDINWNNIVTQFLRYNQIKTKRDARFTYFGAEPLSQMKVDITNQFSAQDYMDLATLFNLLWIDPSIRNSDPVLANMTARANTTNPLYNGTELTYVLQKQVQIMSLVMPEHKMVQDRNQTEIIPSPYSHPIEPILADFGLTADLDAQIKKGIQLYETFFNRTPVGMWSPEMAVNQASMLEMAQNNIVWTATDQNILDLAGVNISDTSNLYTGCKVNVSPSIDILFRSTDLSNAIGFQYASMTAANAVADFRSRILAIQQANTDPKAVVTIALDGENPWENYANNGDDFLNALYANLTQLQSEGKIRTITPKDYFALYPPTTYVPTTQQQVISFANVDISNITQYGDLPFVTSNQAIPEGSWSGKDLRLTIWIGDKQENVAYMWLKKARDAIVQYNASNPGWSATQNYSMAMIYLYRAEASDWCYWYGGDVGSPATFDPIYKVVLREIYHLMTMPPPDYLEAKFYPDGQPVSVIAAKPSLGTPTIDGVIEPNEWKGNFTLAVGGKYINNIAVLNDYNNLYLAITPNSSISLTSLFGQQICIGIYTSSPEISYSPYNIQYNVWARYQTLRNQTMGVAAYKEASIRFNVTSATSQEYFLSTADGTGNYINPVSYTTIGINQTIEIALSFQSLGLTGKDTTYIAVTAAENQSIVDMSAQFDTPMSLKLSTVPVYGQIVFNCTDPQGDDKGPGTYLYPTSAEFVPGVFDMVNFTVSIANGMNMFRIQFVTLGGNPPSWNGPYGFAMQFAQIYIDTDRSGIGRTDTLGARLNISSDDAWKIALSIGGYSSGGNLITFANGTQIRGNMTIYNEGEDTVLAQVPISTIGEANETWRYSVLSLSWDGYSPNNIRPVGAGAAQAYVGGGADSDAVIAGVNSYVYDILTPPDKNQTDELKSYTLSPPKYATIYAVGPALGTTPSGGPAIPIGYIVAVVVVVILIILVAAVLIRRRGKKK